MLPRGEQLALSVRCDAGPVLYEIEANPCRKPLKTKHILFYKQRGVIVQVMFVQPQSRANNVYKLCGEGQELFLRLAVLV